MGHRIARNTEKNNNRSHDDIRSGNRQSDYVRLRITGQYCYTSSRTVIA